MSQAVAVVREDTDHKQLVGYVVASTPDALSATELREFLQQSLPEHMVPGAIVLLDALPLTANGKVDRQRLPEPHMTASVQPNDLPRGPVEQTLAELWSELLRVEQVGRHDNFFALGGHSLLALRLLGQIHQRWQVSIALQSVFKNPTLCKLAEQISGQTAVVSASGDSQRDLATATEFEEGFI